MMNKHDFCNIEVGNIGILLGFFLREKSPLLVSRRTKNNEIEIRLEGIGKDVWSSRFQATNLNDDFKCKHAIITVKAYELRDVLNVIKDKIDYGYIVQNGLGLIELASHYLGEDRAFGLITTYGVTRREEWMSRISGIGKFILGQPGDAPQNNVYEEVFQALQEGGANVEKTRDITPYIWLKVAVNAAINPITTILGSKNKVILENPWAKETAVTVTREVANLAEELGIKLPSDPVQVLFEIADTTSENYCSMLQDFRERRKTEIDFINGRVWRLGKAVGMELPYNRSLYYMVRALEYSKGITPP